jgi:nucleoside-diphosphate-sugar epimerase
MSYIGAVFIPFLKEKNYEVVGYDSGYFSENLLEEFNDDYTKATKDIRDIDKEDLKGIDGIIHLTGLSSDPLGEFYQA